MGHGQGSFDWEVVEAAARIGFWPDLISTDLHSGNVNGAVRDLTNVASKFLLAGMSFKDVSLILDGFFNAKLPPARSVEVNDINLLCA